MSRLTPPPTTAAGITLAGDVTGTGDATTVVGLTIASEVIGTLLQHDGSNWVVLGVGAANEVLTSGGVGDVNAWAAPAVSVAVAGSGTDSAVVGGSGNTATTFRAVASGGISNAAGGINSHISGGALNVIANGSTSSFIHAGSDGDISAAGDYAGILGGQRGSVTAIAAMVMGYMPLGDFPAMHVISGNSGALGDAERGQSQRQDAHLDLATTDATPANMTSIGVELSVPANTSLAVTGKVNCWNETDKKMTVFLVDFDCYSTDGTSVTFVGGDGAQLVHRKDDTGSPGLSIGNTGGTVNFTGTGTAAKDLRWSSALTMARAATA